ncbi:hypothetical protein [Deinococcus multiflagellatus]|uniref:Uncharacterized protein n=1 Tax=Deinococcus multiflagellatus TaxID=1656887 RepID=A0ABW1ZN18_9DEIO|nr:hypothetical protein [Deinococcus multiflagellatus]MBZ9714668.1 hypothetical protein [Deinococcus multiflagellatus]
MTPAQRGYLVFGHHLIYNDEYCEVDEAAAASYVNPAGIYTTLNAAQAACEQQSLDELRQAHTDTLILDEASRERLRAYQDSQPPQDSTLNERLRAVLAGMVYGEHQQPFVFLSDEELQAIRDDLGLPSTHGILEADLDAEQVTQAQQLLDSTPDHPGEWQFNDFLEDFAEDEAVQRLERVTRLFGRSYGLHREG